MATLKTTAFLGHRLISPQPDACCCELDAGEVVGCVLFVSGRNGAVVLEFAEETLDEVAVPVQEGAERGHVDPIGHRLDVGPGTALFQRSPESVAVVPAVGQQGLACRGLAEKVAFLSRSK